MATTFGQLKPVIMILRIMTIIGIKKEEQKIKLPEISKSRLLLLSLVQPEPPVQSHSLLLEKLFEVNFLVLGNHISPATELQLV